MNRLKRKLDNLLIKIVKRIIARDFYFTYWLRPKKEINYDAVIHNGNNTTDVFGIIVQGLIKKDDDFTFETVKLYKKYYPTAKIILSIWDSEPDDVIQKFKKLECEICISKVFEKRMGYDSINLQRQTTLAGVNKALELGCTYIAKTRTDQRICAPDVLSFMVNLQKVFPLKIKTDAKQRIISCSTGTFSNRLYNISDLFLFGTAIDMKRYFNCPFDDRDDSLPKPFDNQSDQIEYSKLRHGEIYFCSHYIESCGFNLKWTLEDSDYYRKELFIICDSESIDLYWPKYTDYEYRWRRYKTDILQQVTFKDWLKQYCN